MKIFISLLMVFFMGLSYSFASSGEEAIAKAELFSRMPRQYILGTEITPTEEEVIAHFTRYVYSKFGLNQTKEALEAVRLLAQSGIPAWQVHYSKHLLEGVYIQANEGEAKRYYLKAKSHESLLSGDIRSLFLELQEFFSSEGHPEKLTDSVKALSVKSSATY